MKEDWKTLDLDNSIELSNLGRVKRNGEIRTYPTDHYIRITIKKKMYYVHRLVYELFVGKIPKDMVIDHINNIKSDNRLINLRLVNRSLNGKNKYNYKKISGVNYDLRREKWKVDFVLNKKYIFIGRFDSYLEAIDIHNKYIINNNIEKDFLISINEFIKEKVKKKTKRIPIEPDHLDGEEWKEVLINNRVICVSNKGRIKFKNQKTGILIITRGTINSQGYRKINITNNSKTKYYLVHRLVYQSFNCDINKKRIIDHIDGDKLNNNLDNLQELSHSLNIHKQKKQKGTTSKYKGVYYLKDRGKWRSHININGKRTNLGNFDTEKEAYNRYLEEYNKLFNNE